MTWYYQGTEFQEENAEGYAGFVYLIENLQTGKKYIGKKLFTFLKAKTSKKKKKRVRKQSDWMTYYGSCQQLKDDVKILGEQFFRREILHLCKSKGECNFLELKEQILRDVLLKSDYYNDYVGSRIHRSHVKGLHHDQHDSKDME